MVVLVFSIGTICRGQGSAYIAVSAACDSGRLFFRAESEHGVSLPIEAYQVNEDEYVLVTPLLETESVVLFCATVDKDGVVTDQKMKKLRRAQIKWLSRLNYRASRSSAFKIRDIDRVTYTRQIHINPTIYLDVPDKDCSIVKGVVCTPEYESNVQLALIAGMVGSSKTLPHLSAQRPRCSMKGCLEGRLI